MGCCTRACAGETREERERERERERAVIHDADGRLSFAMTCFW